MKKLIFVGVIIILAAIIVVWNYRSAKMPRALEKQDIIQVSTPRPNEIVQSPLEIKGKARGYWFFEADFPVRLIDNNGQELGVAIARALSEWMTEDFVPFEAELEFQTPVTKKGLLILIKDNPSGLPEHDDQLRIPVHFSK